MNIILLSVVVAQETANATSRGFDSYSRKLNIYCFYFLALVTRQSASLSSYIEHAIHERKNNFVL